MKIRLGIKTDDEDLVNQKVSCASSHNLPDSQLMLTDLQPQKRKAPEAPPIVRPPAPTQLRLPVRPDGRPAEADLAQLSDRLAEKENELRLDIAKKVQNHSDWNRNHIDLTRQVETNLLID